MKTRVLVGVICVPLLFVALTCLPAVCAGLVIGFIAAFCMLELRRALGSQRGFCDLAYALLAVLMPVLGSLGVGGVYFHCALFPALALTFAELMRKYEKGQDIKPELVFGSVFATCVIPYALTSVAALRGYGGGLVRAYVLLPFVSAFMTDAGAYFAGVFLGKRRAFPRVSPKKTVAGVVGGVISGVGFVFIFWLALEWLVVKGALALPWQALLAVGLLGAGATIFGDLVFSLIKRVSGIKDYGTLIPGHGGMLDRFDSLIFTGPVVYMLAIELLPELIV